MEGQSSAVDKEIFHWSLLAIHTPFSRLEFVCHLLTLPLHKGCRAPNISPSPFTALCQDAVPHGQQQDGRDSSSWMTENVTSYIILQNFTPNSNVFCSSQLSSVLMAENQLEHLLLGMRWRCWKGPSHPDSVTSGAQPDSSDPRKEKISAPDFPCVPYRNIFLLSTGSIKNYIIIS